jgi:hypothetical protein
MTRRDSIPTDEADRSAQLSFIIGRVTVTIAVWFPASCKAIRVRRRLQRSQKISLSESASLEGDAGASAHGVSQALWSQWGRIVQCDAGGSRQPNGFKQQFQTF